MENYFWVTVQNHVFEIDILRNGHRTQRSRESTIDVLALVGPNLRDIEFGKMKRTCLVNAMIARAFEIALLVERHTNVPLEGEWLDTAKSLIGDLPESTFGIRPCPISPTQKVRDVSDSDCHLSYRIQLDVPECSPTDVDILRWALADLEGPVTALGRAWGSEKYTLIGISDCASNDTKFIPNDIWGKILSLLVRLGVDDLRLQMEKAAVFVWDLVDCPVHTGLGKATVITLSGECCSCSVCDTASKEGTSWAAQRETLETSSDSLPDEFVHQWWEGGETSNLDQPSLFKLHFKAVASENTLPTAESLKLRAVKTLAQLEEFRVLLAKHLRRAGISSLKVAQFPRKILQREVERTFLRSPNRSAFLAAALLKGNHLGFKIKGLPTQPFSFLQSSLVQSLALGRTDWTRLMHLTKKLEVAADSASPHYRLQPCKLHTVSAVDNPLLYFQDCGSCPEPDLYGSLVYNSTVQLSTQGVYGSAIWNLVEPSKSTTP